MSQLDSKDSPRPSFTGESFEENDSDDETNSILPDNPSNNTNVFKNLVSFSPRKLFQSDNDSVLANCPDITIIKKEKSESMVNNNSDHSESSSDQGK